MSVFGCDGAKPTLSPDSAVESAKLARFLPNTLGSFAAVAPTETTVSRTVIEARRNYTASDGRKLDVRLMSGDLGSVYDHMSSDDEHAFGSDSPTYWRTTSVLGKRARIGEHKVNSPTSEADVQVGPNLIAQVIVTRPLARGEAATLAALLDLEGLSGTRGLPRPSQPSRRR